MIRSLVALIVFAGAGYLLFLAVASRDNSTSTVLTVHGIRVGMSAEAVQQVLGAPRPSGGGYSYAHDAVHVTYTPRTDVIQQSAVPGNVKLVHGTNLERDGQLVATKAYLRSNVIKALGLPQQEASDAVTYEGEDWRLKISFDAEGPDGKLTYVELSAR